MKESMLVDDSENLRVVLKADKTVGVSAVCLSGWRVRKKDDMWAAERVQLKVAKSVEL